MNKFLTVGSATAAVAASYLFGGATEAKAAVRPDFGSLSALTFSQPTLRDGFAETGIEPHFLANAAYHPWELNFGIPNSKMDQVIDIIWGTMSRSQAVDHVKGRSPEDTARMIRGAVDSIMAQNGIINPNKLLHQWLVAEGVCAWVETRMLYSTANYDENTLLAQGKPAKEVLNNATLSGVCSDFALLTRDLARLAGEDLGLQAHWIRHGRSLAGEIRPKSHAMVGFTFDGDFRSVADNVGFENRVFVDRKPYNGWSVLPRTREAMEMVLGSYHIQKMSQVDYGDPQNLYMQDRRFIDWKVGREQLAANKDWREKELPFRKALDGLKYWWQKNYPWSY